MDREVKHALRALEERIKALEARPIASPQVAAAPDMQAVINAYAANKRGMCPKCGEQPGYFFHVKSCKGPKNATKQKEEKTDGEDADRRRDQGTT